jgi:hypothetical protein
MSGKYQSNLSLAQFIWGILVTLVICIVSVVGSYMSLREGDIERNQKIHYIEERVIKIEQDQKITDQRYLEILEKLSAIQIKLEGKKDRE